MIIFSLHWILTQIKRFNFEKSQEKGLVGKDKSKKINFDRQN